jgi:RHS repeat-associated protein
VYDGDKRRVSSKNAAGAVTKFLYDGLNNLKDYAADGETVLASYTQGIGIDKLISRTDAQGARYFHADALGSTRLMTDGDEDTVATYVYDAWGKLTSPPNQNDGNKFKFTAREFEDEIGLQYNRARFYDPGIGRFITQDPLTKGPDDPTICYKNNIYSTVERAVKEYVNAFEPHRTLNRYVYCCNNPINFIDPLGLEAAWYDELSQWGHSNLEISKDAVNNSIPTDNAVSKGIGEVIATAVNTAMELGTGLLDIPSNIGHLGEGTGKFSANPTLENAAGVAKDVSVAAGVLATGLSGVPSAKQPLGASGGGGASKGPASRPSWRESESDLGKALEKDGYKPQVSFKDGAEVKYGTKSSSRPDYYKEGSSVDIKNYNIETAKGQSRLVDRVSEQAMGRAKNLPPGTTQKVQVDARGQNAPPSAKYLGARIEENSQGAVKAENVRVVE